MSLQLHKIVQDIIHNVNEFEEIELFIPSIKNTKGILEKSYGKPKILKAQIQNMRYRQDLQDNKPRHIQECSIYLDKDEKINYINAILKIRDAFWQIQEIEEEGKTWLKCKACQQKAIKLEDIA